MNRSASPGSERSRSGATLEPAMLAPSRKPWLMMAVGGGVLCAGSLLGVTMGGDTAAIFLAVLFGCCAVLGAIMLLPGANSLRLDADGFEVEHLFRKKRYRWDDVSGFAMRNVGQYDDKLVSFDTPPEVRRNLWDRINGALIGKSAYLPGTYGMPADDLAKLMTDWKNSATLAAATRSSTATDITDN